MAKKKILVVDDDRDLILTIKKVLDSSSDKYEVISAESGMQCLQLLKNNQIPDIILLDIMMPEMSGWETFNRLKINPLWKKIPIVFLTARTDRTAKNAGGFLGTDYIEKPFDTDDLKGRIDKILEG